VCSQVVFGQISAADCLDSFLFDHKLPLAQAPEGYALFEQRKTQKVIFML
jgi:hypothetical protein